MTNPPEELPDTTPDTTSDTTAKRSGRGARGVVAAVSGVAVVGALATVALLGDQWAQGLNGAEQQAVGAATRTVAVEPAEESLVCPGPAALPEDADVGDSQFDAAPVETRSTLGTVALGAAAGDEAAGLSPARTTGLGDDDAAGLAGSDSAVVRQEDATGARVLRATPVAGDDFRTAGALASVTAAGDLRGLAAGSCTAPSTSHWLVGGRTTVGATSTLTVANPTDRPATVTLDVYGPGGPLALGGGGTFTVAAHDQVSTRLEAVAPEQDRLAVHVTSAGARVSASLQQQTIDGLLPAGVDLVAAGSAPARAVSVSGVTSRGEAVEDPHAPRLRLLAPGKGGATARVHVYGPSGEVTLRGVDEVELDAGVVTDLPLGGLPEGTYAVVVDASAPVVAGARLDRPGEQPKGSVVEGTPYDIAWSSGLGIAAGSGTSGGQVALPTGVRAVVALTGVPADRGVDVDPQGTGTVTVRVLDSEGAEAGSRDVDVAAGSTADVPVSDLVPEGTVPAAVLVDPAEGAEPGVVVRWSAVLVADDGTEQTGTLVSTLTPTATRTASGSVEVRGVDAAG